MSTSINTNISALAAQGSLRKTGLSQATAMERLSTGIRINSAKDDAAGLAISTRMTANIRGIAAAVRNANDGISLTQTAEGSLNAISDNLQRIRELAVQSANTGNNVSDRAALNSEAKQLIAEIDRVANNTTFNGIKLLDGTFTGQDLQVGAGNGTNDRINLSIASAKASSLGNGTYAGSAATVNSTAVVASSALVANSLAINGYSVGSSVSDGVSFVGASGSGIAKALAINSISGNTGVSATVTATTKVGVAPTTFTAATTAGAVMINGVDIGPMGAANSAIDRGAQTAATINSKSAQTGVTATADAGTGAVSLSAKDGRNITVSTTTAGGTATGLITTAVGIAPTGTANIAANVMTINGVNIGAVTWDTNIATTAPAIQSAINAKTSETGVTASVANTGVVTLSVASGDGRGITIGGTPADVLASFGLTTSSSTATSTLKLTTTNSTGITLAGSAGLLSTGLTAGNTATVATASGTFGAGVSAVDLTSAENSQAALTTLDSAIDQITNSRAAMGAYQNRLTATISNLETTSMNLQASRSRILDTDYAKETTNLAKSQIITQAATAMLAQANQSAQSVLALLK
jgi:flagellin